jgi:hypothetical protein
VGWIKTKISYSANSEVNIGKKRSDPKTHLYANYLEFCKEYGFRVLMYNIFSTTLLQQLQVLVNSNIDKVRRNSGTVITNIALNKNINNELLNTLESDKIDIMNEFKGYTENSLQS